MPDHKNIDPTELVGRTLASIIVQDRAVILAFEGNDTPLLAIGYELSDTIDGIALAAVATQRETEYDR